MMIFGFIFVLVIAGAIAYTVGWRPESVQTGLAQTSQTPLEIVKARYVRGDITRDEYDQIRRDLEA